MSTTYSNITLFTTSTAVRYGSYASNAGIKATILGQNTSVNSYSANIYSASSQYTNSTLYITSSSVYYSTNSLNFNSKAIQLTYESPTKYQKQYWGGF